jgi:hypothetical protein
MYRARAKAKALSIRERLTALETDRNTLLNLFRCIPDLRIPPLLSVDWELLNSLDEDISERVVMDVEPPSSPPPPNSPN